MGGAPSKRSVARERSIGNGTITVVPVSAAYSPKLAGIGRANKN
jgi:hypothetical protein